VSRFSELSPMKETGKHIGRRAARKKIAFHRGDIYI